MGVYFLYFSFASCSAVLQEGALGKWYFFVLLMAFMVELPGVYSCCMNECMDWGDEIRV